MFSIGEFSRITGLTVKTIRFYHEKQILIPARVESGSGYRYFDNCNIETARVISSLRAMEFSVDEIKSILESCDQDEDVVQQLEQRKHEITKKIDSQTEIANRIDRILKQQRAFTKLAIQEGVIEERVLPSMIIGGIRMTGKYSDVGRAFGKLGRALGRHISGSAMCLYFDTEYKEEAADFEPCFPIRARVDNPNISIRELPSCFAICLKHVGPYESLGSSYAMLFEYANENELKKTAPSREVFLKGPGVIFKGSSRKYVTEIQMVVTRPDSSPSNRRTVGH